MDCPTGKVAMTLPEGCKDYPRPPTFRSLLEERDHRKQRLVAGIAGHITVRDTEKTDHFWVNPFGKDFAQIRISDLVLVSSEGKVVEGKHPINNAAFIIHSRIHQARPEVIAVAHAHSTYGKAWSTLRRLLSPLTQDSCAFFKDHGLFADYTGVVYDPTESQRIAESLGPFKAVILANHGLLTVGKTVDEAVWWFISMDRCCHTQLLAEAAGNPIIIPENIASLTHEQVGSTFSGWFCAQPLFSRILKEISTEPAIDLSEVDSTEEVNSGWF